MMQEDSTRIIAHKLKGIFFLMNFVLHFHYTIDTLTAQGTLDLLGKNYRKIENFERGKSSSLSLFARMKHVYFDIRNPWL